MNKLNPRFLLLDDHSIVTLGLKVILSAEYRAAVFYEAESIETAVEVLKEHTIDIMVMDINLPDGSSIALMEWIEQKMMPVRVIVFSMNPVALYGKRFLKLGAWSYLTKESPKAEIIFAINQILNNKKYLSAELIQIVSEDLIQGRSNNPFDKLSAREFQVASVMSI